MLQAISLLMENKPGALLRVTGLLGARGFNIESLTVAETLDPHVSRITLVTHGDDQVVAQINKQLNKLVSVIEVHDFNEVSHVERELALIKVTADQQTRAEVMHIVDIFRGNVIDVSPQSYLIEVTGTEDKIAALLELLKPLGIQEIARTGKVAMHRGMQLMRGARGTKERVA